MLREKGFTLIELLVVIALLGIIASVVALNVGHFFDRGTVQAANTELHQVVTAVISCMAECETSTLAGFGWWNGGNGTIYAGCNRSNGDAAYYVYGPFRATYYVTQNGYITSATCNDTGQWHGIHFCDDHWQIEPCT